MTSTAVAPSLPALPAQPPEVPWPTRAWTRAEPDAADAGLLEETVRALTELDARDGATQALLVVQDGRLVLERYGAGIERTTTLQSWSMAKSVLHAVVGLALGDGLVRLDEPVAAPEWVWAEDLRAMITVRHLLAMRSGLAFSEDYVHQGASDVMAMLWGEGRDDVARYAAHKEMEAAPGSHFHYSSGTSNLLARLVGDRIGGGEAGMRGYLRERLFEPLGMTTPIPKFDAAGTWKASSFCFCSAEDFARFGLLYLRDGFWEDRRLLPEGWADTARTPTYLDGTEGYGMHWWVDAADPRHFFASGYRGQRILIAPEKDLIAVRLGESPNERVPELLAPLHRLVDAFPDR